MKKKFTKVITIIFLIFGMLFTATPTKVKATASIAISGVPSIVQPGAIFDVTVSIPGYLGGMVTLSGFNCTIISQNTVLVDGSASFTVRAGSAGTAYIQAEGSEITPTDVNKPTTNGFGRANFTIAAPSNNNGGGGGGTQVQQPSKPQTPQNQQNQQNQQNPQEDVNDKRSDNNNLASLAISSGKLTPAFHAETTEYRVELAATVTSINITASAADAKAKVNGTGTKALEPGENKFSITVTAENGAVKTYTIVAVVNEKPLVYTKYNGKDLGVVRNVKDIKAPKDFVETTVKLDGKEVKAWKNDAMKITLVYLIDEKTSEKNFYIYDTKKQMVTNIFKPTAILGNNVYLVDIPKELQTMEGFEYEKVKVDTTELMGWTFKDKAFDNYVVIYVMDETGKMQYYMYEKTQNTLQLYSKAAPVTQESYEKLIKNLENTNKMQVICLGVAAVLTVVAIVAVVFAIKLKKQVK